jgi:hypothetical protein
MKYIKNFSLNESLKSEDDFEKHIEDIFNDTLSYHTPERQADEKEGMIKAYKFLSKYPKIGGLAYERMVQYMWEIYPTEGEIYKRTGMLMSYDYLSGQYDNEQKERSRIGKLIRKKMEEKNKKD